MGRKKLPILAIDDPKQRTITFNKRKSGFLKKAAELAKLCNIKMFVAFTDVFENLVLYYNEDMEFLDLDKYRERSKKIYSFTNNDYPQFFKTKKQQKNDLSFSFNTQNLRNHQRPIQIIKSISKPIVENPKQDNQSPNKLFTKQENNTITSESNGITLNKTKRSLSIKIPENNKELENRMKCIKIIHDVNGPNEINERKIFNEVPKINNEGNMEQNDLQKLLYSYSLRNQLYSGDYLSLKQPISLLFSNNSKEKKDYRLFPGEDHIFVKSKKKKKN